MAIKYKIKFLLFQLVQIQIINSTGAANSQINNKCTDNEIQFNVCQNDFIPLPNPFETCQDGQWTGSKCFKTNNIASGKRFLTGTSLSDSEAIKLSQSEPINPVGIPQSTRREWTVDLENFYFVYSIVIDHYIQAASNTSEP